MGRGYEHQKLKGQVFIRDNNRCVKCGCVYKKGFYPGSCFTNLVADHIIPIKLGGSEFDINNIQTLCIDCNREKNRIDQSKIAEYKRRMKNDHKKEL